MLGLLAEGSTVEALTMEAVAARAGVGKATIYRRFADKDELVLAAVEAVKPAPPEPLGQSVRDDLIAIARHVTRVREGIAGQIMPCMVPELQRPGRLRDLYLKLVEDRREVTRSVLRRGIATGELRAGHRRRAGRGAAGRAEHDDVAGVLAAAGQGPAGRAHGRHGAAGHPRLSGAAVPAPSRTWLRGASRCGRG